MMEYALLNADSVTLLVIGLMMLGAAIVGFALGYLTKNYQVSIILEQLEDRIERMTGQTLDDVFDEYK